MHLILNFCVNSLIFKKTYEVLYTSADYFFLKIL